MVRASEMDTIGDQEWPPIQLAWRQKLAAFWSIAWLSLLASLFLLFAVSGVLTSDKIETPESLGALGLIAALVSNLAFLVVQMVLVPRLWHKRYRSFRVRILREDATSNTTLSVSEVIRVGLRLVWPQAAFMVITAIAVMWAETAMDDAMAARAVSSLFVWLRFLLVGPYALHFAVPRSYPGFRLQTYGQRFV
jgi:hypothetical protein